MTFKNWLETHFSSQGISAFVSSEIEKGSQWLPAVDAELREADAGLVCLTAKNLGSEWVSFEARALAAAVALRKVEPRIFTYLLGVKPASLPDPLAAYQSTVATMEDTLRLINSLLSYLNLQKMSVESFVDPWEDLWNRLQAIENEPVTNLFPGVADLFDRKTFREPIDQCTDQPWFQRYKGAMVTRNKLQAQADLVSAECDVQVADLYRDLIAAVDGYAMDLSALLFEPRTYDLADDGFRAVSPGVRTGLERRRITVHELVAQITDTRQQPRTREAVRFARSPTGISFTASAVRMVVLLGRPRAE